MFWSLCIVPVILVRFSCNFNFLGRFSKNNKYKFHENPSSGSEVVPCGQTGGQTKLVVGFCNSVNAPKNGHVRKSYDGKY
jgi:hypothetical protein